MSNTEQNKYQLSKQELIKKTVSLSAALSGVAAANYPSLLVPVTYYINAYVFLDLFFAKRDMIAHHLLVLSFFAAIKMHTFPVEYEVDFTNQVIRFEYSTLFYSGGPILLHCLSTQSRSDAIQNDLRISSACTREAGTEIGDTPAFLLRTLRNPTGLRPSGFSSKWMPIIRTALHVGFGITFFKFRIYDYSGNIIFRAITYSPDNFPSAIAFVHLISTTWAFYALNLYWLQLIIWKLVPSKK